MINVSGHFTGTGGAVMIAVITARPTVVLSFCVGVGGAISIAVTVTSTSLVSVSGESCDELCLGGCKLRCECLDGGSKRNHGGAIGCCGCGELGDCICCFRLVALVNQVVGATEVGACLGCLRFSPFLVRKCELNLERWPRFLGGGEAFPFFAVVDKDSCFENQCICTIGDGDGRDMVVAMVGVRYGFFDLEEQSFDGEIGVIIRFHSCFVEG